MIIIQIIVVIIYFCKSLYSIRKYIFSLTDKFISYISLPKNDMMVSNYNNSLSRQDKKKIKLKEPPKKRAKINNDNIKRNNNKAKTKLEKNKKDPNIVKRRSLKPEKYIMKNIILENNYQNNISIHNNSKKTNELIDSGISKNISNSNLINISKKKKIHSIKKSIKHNLDEMFLNSNDNLKYKLSNPSIQTNVKSSLMLNSKEENDINMDEYLSTEPDDMDYDDAVKRDKRAFCQYFYDKLKINQLILSTFLIKEPLRPRTLKILLFILNIDLYLFINGLFFTEDYISQMLHVSEDEGILPFIERFMERFLYITFEGVIVGYIIECFFVEEKKIKGIFKREKENIIILKYEITRIIKSINSRNNWFILLSFVITIFTLYYVFCFNNIYPSMKGEWIKTSIIIIFSMQALSILQSFLETSIRFISFKCKSEKIYKISLLLS